MLPKISKEPQRGDLTEHFAASDLQLLSLRVGGPRVDSPAMVKELSDEGKNLSLATLGLYAADVGRRID